MIDVACQVNRIEEPTTIENALSGEYSKEWKAAADLEYSALMANQTWSLVELYTNGQREKFCWM